MQNASFIVSTRDQLVQLSFDSSGQLLAEEPLVAVPRRASALAIARSGETIYATFDGPEADTHGFKGRLHCYRKEAGQWILADSRSSLGNTPCEIALAFDSPYLSVSNYRGARPGHGGTAAVFPLDDDGLPQTGSFVSFPGSGPHERQEAAHPHASLFADSPFRLYVADLGSDSLWELDPKNLPESEPAADDPALIRHPTPPGTGPRQIADFQNGHGLFVTMELGKSLFWLQPDVDMSLDLVAEASLKVPGFGVSPADVRVSPDYRHVYASVRGSNTIHSFAIDENEPSLIALPQVESGGDRPRWMALSNDGSLIAVSHPGSDNVRIFKRELETGALNPLPSEFRGGGPIIALPAPKSY